MNCEEVRPQLEPYLDGELERAGVDVLESHLATCGACRAALAPLEELRHAVRAAPRYRAPPGLRRRLDDLGTGTRLEARSGGGFRPGWWAMAATLLLGTVLGAVFMNWRTGGVANEHGSQLGRDLLASHLRALAAVSAVDVVSEDRHTVKPWFAGKIGESPPVIDTKSEEFPLLGGRIDYVGEHRAAVVVYGHRKHVIDVYVLPGSIDPVSAPASTLGFALTPCQLAGQSAWIVSDIDAESLRRFRGLIGCDGAP